ncbi:MAG: hypothetical protein RL325_958 [Planctomycetota bacterium]|jgi:hypothetical protein
MDSPRIIPFHAAAAYGIKPKQPAPRAGAPIAPPVAHKQDGRSPLPGLVSGKVDSPVSRGQGFETPLAPSGSLQMYTRAADRVEVATAARLGRILDTRA